MGIFIVTHESYKVQPYDYYLN